MVTLNQVVRNLNNIATAHYQIKSFGEGSVQDFATSGVTDYPAMWVDYEPVSLRERNFYQVVRIYVADRLMKGKRNQLEVLSDVQQICLDIIAQCKSTIYGWVLESSSITLNVFTEPRFDDEDAGYYFDLTLKLPFDFNRCQIPFNSTITNNDINPVGGAGTINVYLDGVLQSTTESSNLDSEIVNILWT